MSEIVFQQKSEYRAFALVPSRLHSNFQTTLMHNVHIFLGPISVYHTSWVAINTSQFSINRIHLYMYRQQAIVSPLGHSWIQLMKLKTINSYNRFPLYKSGVKNFTNYVLVVSQSVFRKSQYLLSEVGRYLLSSFN